MKDSHVNQRQQTFELIKPRRSLYLEMQRCSCIDEVPELVHTGKPHKPLLLGTISGVPLYSICRFWQDAAIETQLSRSRDPRQKAMALACTENALPNSYVYLSTRSSQGNACALMSSESRY
jgi:hypothetical protein